MLDDRTEAVLRRLEREYLEAVERGFLGPREGARLRERHIDDALGLATLRPPMPGEQWVDLGSGAGLPGLPLAVAFPASRFTLVDAHRRRVDWVASTTAALHLANVSVVHARLEDYGRSAAREHFDVATARALGPLPVAKSWGNSSVPAKYWVPKCAKLSPIRARRLTRLAPSLSWRRSPRPPPASPGDLAYRQGVRSAGGDLASKGSTKVRRVPVERQRATTAGMVV